MNRYDDAVEELEHAVDLKAADATINDHLGDAYWRVGRKLEAIFQWQTSLELKPEADEMATLKTKIREGLPPIEIKAEAPKAAEPVKVTEAEKPAAPAATTPVAPAPAAPDAKPADTTPVPPAPTTAPAVTTTPMQTPVETKPLVETPAEPAPAATAPDAAPAAMDDAHTVIKGDNLWNIARDLLGDGHRFHEIIQLNPELRRHPDMLQPGQMLKLPVKN